MIFRIFVSFFICLLIANTATAYEKSEEEFTSEIHCSSQPHDFFLLTLPKSGTHLIAKLLVMLTSKKISNVYEYPAFLTENNSLFYPQLEVEPDVLENYLFEVKKKRQFSLSHFNFSEFYQIFQNQHPEFLAIINIRDLRDFCISLIDWMWDDIEKKIGPSTYSQKLTYVLTCENQNVSNLYLNCQRISEWYFDRPNTIIVKFEELIGPQGGGSLEKQKETILRIANALSYDLADEHLNHLADQLWGIKKGYFLPTTFNQGKIGRWRLYFSEGHKRLFKEKFGEYLIQFGYEQDNNW